MKAELFPFQKKALSQLRLMAGEAIHGYQSKISPIEWTR